MGKGLENFDDNTYGIEIEFCTHSEEMLSFTHIEVCYLFVDGSDKKDGWKIETDSYYTFELVSPILHFKTQEEARDFRNSLMEFLELSVMNGISLGSLMKRLNLFVSDRFNFVENVWTYPRQSGLKNPSLNMAWALKTGMKTQIWNRY